MDYSKNEILAMLFIYRKKTVNMTEIAEYINAPLNTATGVIGRLEKKVIAKRTRDVEDKRVVNISLTQQGQAFIEDEKKILEYYFKKLYEILSEEEKRAAMSIVNKVIAVVKAGTSEDKREEKEVKKVKRIMIE